ncbi:MAG: MraY family glycosyltransferase [Actinomycetota bacterium]
MSEGSRWWYVATFAGPALLSLVLTPLALKVALRRQLLDHPGGHKGHESPVPYLGGLAMVAAFSLAVVAGAIVRPPHSGRDELVAVVAIALALSLVGLLDDLRHLGAWVRILCEVGAGLGLWAAGVGVELFPADAANAAFTVLWVVGITNAFNLLDNMDGLSAGVAAIAAGGFFVIAAANRQFLVASLAAATAGCAVGFLRHNFHPARIYMGDSGSLFLGFMIAYLGVKLRFEGPTHVTFLVPIVVIGIAIFDTTLVTVSRLLHRRSPFQGGRDHVSHRLVAVGVPVPAAVSVIYGAAISLAVIALVVSRIERAPAYWLAGMVGALGIFLGVLLARVRVYDDAVTRRLSGRGLASVETDPGSSAKVGEAS